MTFLLQAQLGYFPGCVTLGSLLNYFIQFYFTAFYNNRNVTPLILAELEPGGSLSSFVL